MTASSSASASTSGSIRSEAMTDITAPLLHAIYLYWNFYLVITYSNFTLSQFYSNLEGLAVQLRYVSSFLAFSGYCSPATIPDRLRGEERPSRGRRWAARRRGPSGSTTSSASARLRCQRRRWSGGRAGSSTPPSPSSVSGQSSRSVRASIRRLTQFPSFLSLLLILPIPYCSVSALVLLNILFHANMRFESIGMLLLSRISAPLTAINR